MDKQPLVSIVLPVYNASKYIGECIESILGQPYPYFELIILDDGSVDSTIAEMLKFRDNRIQLIKKKHNFIDTLNTGLRHCKINDVTIVTMTFTMARITKCKHI